MEVEVGMGHEIRRRHSHLQPCSQQQHLLVVQAASSILLALLLPLDLASIYSGGRGGNSNRGYNIERLFTTDILLSVPANGAIATLTAPAALVALGNTGIKKGNIGSKMSKNGHDNSHVVSQNKNSKE